MAFMRNIEDLGLWADKIFECCATELNGPLWWKFVSTDCGGLANKALEENKHCQELG